MAPLSVDRLLYKGTHNSYDRHSEDRLVDLPEQINDFGVWAVELDFSIPREDGRPPRAVVGHDGPGQRDDNQPLDGGDPDSTTVFDQFRLEFFLQQIARSSAASSGDSALRYRPLFIYFEKKIWRQLIPGGFFPIRTRLDDRDFDDHSKFLGVLETELRRVFGSNIFGPALLDAYLNAHRGAYPTVPELAGQIIPVIISFIGEPVFVDGTDLIFHDGRCIPPCRSFNVQATLAEHCDGLSSIPDAIHANNIVRVDNFQDDASFEFSIPPNPIVVAAGAPSETRIMGCDQETTVHQQGTYQFPFDTVTKAVERAKGLTNDGAVDLRKSGIGWTLSIGPGNYLESLRIDLPLTLQKAVGFAGKVAIGS